MILSTLLLPSLLSLSTAAPATSHYYLKTTPSEPTQPLYLSSSITYNGHTNYVLLTSASLAQPLSLFPGSGSITLDTSNVIGASSHAPLLLADTAGWSEKYKQVVLGDVKSGEYTTGFEIGGDGVLRLGMDGFGGFVACTAAKGVKQVYWFEGGGEEGEVPVVCEEVEFVAEVALNGTVRDV
ncbi:hypothetical protein BJX99DRAFT_268967 [Aspergillus californicus]